MRETAQLTRSSAAGGQPCHHAIFEASPLSLHPGTLRVQDYALKIVIESRIHFAGTEGRR